MAADPMTLLPAGIITALVILVPLLVFLFLRRDVTVSCWFCQACTQVPRGNANCWDCPQCDQYNGFSPSGDYNKRIPAQYHREFNHTAGPFTEVAEFATNSDVLCTPCNRNQSLKVRQLANFEPLNEASWDRELATFRRQLDHAYKLCQRCQRRASDRVRQCDVIVLPRYVQWRKKTALKRDSELHWWTLVHSAVAFTLFYLTAGVNLGSAATLAGRSLGQSWTKWGQFTLLTVCLTSTCLHLLLCTLYFRRINMPLLIHLGVLLTLTTNHIPALKIDTPARLNTACHLTSGFLSLAGLLFRVGLRPPSRRRLVKPSSSSVSSSPPGNGGNEAPSRLVCSVLPPTPPPSDVASSFYSCRTENPFLLQHTAARTSLCQPPPPSVFSESSAQHVVTSSSLIAPPRFVYNSSSGRSVVTPKHPSSILSRSSTPESWASKCSPPLRSVSHCGAPSIGEEEEDESTESSSCDSPCGSAVEVPRIPTPPAKSLLSRCLLGVAMGIGFTCCLHLVAVPLLDYLRLFLNRRIRIL